MTDLDIRTGTEGSPFAGRIFVKPEPHHKLVRLQLRLMNAEFKGTSYLLPKDAGSAILLRLRAAADHDASALREAALCETVPQEYLVRCEMLEIALLKRRAAAASGAARQSALAAARDRLSAMTPEQLTTMSRILADETARVDRCRTIVIAGEIQPGDEIIRSDEPRKVAELSPVWKISAGELPKLQKRFPDVSGLRAGAEVQYAAWRDAEPVPEPA